MRLDHLLSKEEEVRVLYTVELLRGLHRMADRKEQENLFSWDWMDDRLYWRALRNGLGSAAP